MRRLIIATALLALMAGSAAAQRKPYSSMSDDEKAQQKVADSVDRQYRSTLDKTRKDANTASVDPWAIVRGVDNPKPKH